MKFLVTIDAPNYGKGDWGRAVQFECGRVAKLVHLFASRIEMGMGPGADMLSGDGVTLHYRVKHSTPAEGEAA